LCDQAGLNFFLLPRLLQFSLVVGSTVAIAALSWRLVERPINSLKDRVARCRVGLPWSFRQHIAVCAVVRQNYHRWQAPVPETLTHARETREASQQLRDATELTRVESDGHIANAKQAGEGARQAPQESERVKRSDKRDGKQKPHKNLIRSVDVTISNCPLGGPVTPGLRSCVGPGHPGHAEIRPPRRGKPGRGERDRVVD